MAAQDDDALRLEIEMRDVQRFGPVVTRSNSRARSSQVCRIHRDARGQFWFVARGGGVPDIESAIEPADAAARSRVLARGKLTKYGAAEFRKLGLDGTPVGRERIYTKSDLRMVNR
jgi:hypothetical protein